MDVESILATLRGNRATLAGMGILHASVFGSVARGEARADSDIDILIDFAPGQVPDIFTFVGVRDRVAALFPGRVDVIDQAGLRPAFRERVLHDAVHAF